MKDSSIVIIKQSSVSLFTLADSHYETKLTTIMKNEGNVISAKHIEVIMAFIF